ncbi:MAG: TaqI-like C-terminal specificity domain-containing protein [Planctomycetota bacterium]
MTGLNEAFVVDRAARDRLIAEHPSSEDVLKPFLRGRDVKRWQVAFANQYLIKIESSENKVHPWSSKPEKEAEKVFAKTYPAIHGFFDDLRTALIARYDQGKYFWELRSCDYWQEFEQPKVIYPNICARNEFAWDDLSFYANQKTFIIPNATKFLLGYLNSSVVMWLFSQLIPKLQNGFYEPGAKFMGQFPIPPATPDQQRCCERLAEALIWLHGKGAARRPKSGSQDLTTLPSDNAPHGLMAAYFEQWLNGLVYELFFPDDLHARNLKLFDETARLNLPDLAKVPESRKLAALREIFDKAHDDNQPLREALEDLHKVEEIRIIEESGNDSISSESEDKS